MCGIAGFWSKKAREGEQGLKALAQEMADSIQNRGPDAGDSWADAGAGVAFGHRRLAIIDLSEAGAQPMSSSCGRFVIC